MTLIAYLIINQLSAPALAPVEESNMAAAPYEYGQVSGHFIESQYGNRFDYSDNTPTTSWLPVDEYPHLIWVNGGYRYGKVLKTVAYVVIDENEDGKPVVMKWSIKQHRQH